MCRTCDVKSKKKVESSFTTDIDETLTIDGIKGYHKVYKFKDNPLKISVILHKYSMGNEKGLFEVGFISNGLLATRGNLDFMEVGKIIEDFKHNRLYQYIKRKEIRW